MYKYLIFPLLALLIFFSGCNDDDQPVIMGTRLSYDGANNTSPFQPAGEYEAAAHFPASVIEGAVGRELVSVQYNVYTPPATGFIKIYASNGSSTPGVELYRANVTGEIIANSWNTHELMVPMPIISGEGIWISFNFLHDGEQQTMGCDAVSEGSNGDWLYDQADMRWQTFRVRTGEDINWNIRGVLSI